jgi:CheY-like chemotaxis protein
MKDIIDWLISMESMAGELYTKASVYFQDDQELEKFLSQLAKDEAWHLHVMEMAAEQLQRIDLKNNFISLDDETKSKLESPFLKCSDMLSAGQLTKASMIDYIIETELSEWNDIFIYVVDTLKKELHNFKHTAIKIQGHKRYVEHYLISTSYGSKQLHALRNLKPVWKEKILIVDDAPVIVNLLTSVLAKDGEIETAENGKEGLEKLNNNYFKVVVSDLDMPLMNGRELYEKAIALYPNIKERFLFFTGNLSDKALSFFNDHEVSYLNKPATIKEIKDNIYKILQKTDVN